MSDLIWLVFIFLVVILVISVLWFIWRLRHFSQSHNNQTVLDDKLMQSMLGDEALSKELKRVLVGKASGVKYPTETGEENKEAGLDRSDAGQQSPKEHDMKREEKI